MTGGALAAPERQRDVKDLYKLFIEERMGRVGGFDAELDADARDLQVRALCVCVRVCVCVCVFVCLCVYLGCVMQVICDSVSSNMQT